MVNQKVVLSCYAPCATADCCRGSELRATHLAAQFFIQIETGLDLAQVCFLSQQGLESLHLKAGISLQPTARYIKGCLVGSGHEVPCIQSAEDWDKYE